MAAFDSEDDEIFEVLDQVSPIRQKSFKRLRIAGSKQVDSSILPNPSFSAVIKQDAKSSVHVKRPRKPRAKNLVSTHNNAVMENAVFEKRMSAEEILKSFGKDIHSTESHRPEESSRKRKTVQRSLLGIVTSMPKNDDALPNGAMIDPLNSKPNMSSLGGPSLEAGREFLPDVRAVDAEVAITMQNSVINEAFERPDLGREEFHDQDENSKHREKDNVAGMLLHDASNEGSEEEVDEDNEEAILNLLERKHKATQDTVQQLPNRFEEKNLLGNADDLVQQRNNKKIKKNDVDVIHAESQRLLRETRGVAFQAMQAAGKPISFILEKIRLRKLQLTSGLGKKTIASQKGAFTTVHVHGDATHVGNSKTSTNDSDSFDDGILVIEPDCPIEQQAMNNKYCNLVSNCDSMVEGAIKEVNEIGYGQNVQENQYETDNAPTTAGHLTGHSVSCLDLFSQSQASNLEEIPGDVICDKFLGSGLPGDLRLDTFTEDEEMENLPGHDSNKENIDPKSGELALLSRGVSHVRALVDDEAEDEDDEDALDDEDVQEDGEDLKDLVVATNEEEKADDADKRFDLHRKWLEQQDAAMTDDILFRLKTGWAPREPRAQGLDFLNEEDDREWNKINCTDGNQLDTDVDEPDGSLDGNSQDSGVLHSDEDELNDGYAVPKDTFEIDDMHESDDDEIEQKILRQRFLQESEEQEEFLSPADDETSREVFGLINKVNIVSNKRKPGSFETRGSSSNSKSSSSWGSKSFLRKTSSLSVTVTKQSSGGSISRSFIFGRDDSNSNHSQSNTDSQSEMVVGDKENTSLLQRCTRKDDNPMSNSARNSAAKCNRASPAGASLFEILKRQAVDLEEALQSKDANTVRSMNADGSLFTAFKSLRFDRTYHGI